MTRAVLPALLAAVAAFATTPAGAEPRAVVELFTSQGCSSCPPADRLLGELAQDPSLVVMSLPIDYWDYIGWKDTLAKPRHTARQRFYAKTRGDGDVFTPQVVINGVTHAVGNDKTAIEHAIAESRHEAATLSLPVTLAVADGKLNVSIPAGAEKATGEVWLCALGTAVPVAIARGVAAELGAYESLYGSSVREMDRAVAAAPDTSNSCCGLVVPMPTLAPEFWLCNAT